MRLFFALPIPDRNKQDIDDWRQRVFPPLEKPIRPAKFHITLAFLGNCSDRQLDQLCAVADSVTCDAFSLLLNDTGYWPKPGILWLGPSTTPDPLKQLVKQLRSVAHDASVQLDKKPYKPHLTLARGIKTAPVAPVSPPQFSIAFNEFVLFESVSGKNGVYYQPVASWQLQDG